MGLFSSLPPVLSGMKGGKGKGHYTSGESKRSGAWVGAGRWVRGVSTGKPMVALEKQNNHNQRIENTRS